MNILVIDAQGGGIGKQVISATKKKYGDTVNIIAVGTNSIATTNMLKAGADAAATGENSVVVCSKSADVIIGPVGIVIADAMLGEITERMAVAIGRSAAKRIFIPVNHCDNRVVGVADISMSQLVDSAVNEIGKLMNE